MGFRAVASPEQGGLASEPFGIFVAFVIFVIFVLS
jgi:hypothetical protein